MSFVKMRKRGIDALSNYRNMKMRGHNPPEPEVSAKERPRSVFSQALDVIETVAGAVNPVAGAGVATARAIGRARKRAKKTKTA